MEEVEWPASASGEKRGMKVKREESEKDRESVWKRREDKNPDLIQSGDCPMEEEEDLYWPLRKVDVDLSWLEIEGYYQNNFWNPLAAVQEIEKQELKEAISSPDLEKSLTLSDGDSDSDNSATPLSDISRVNIEAYLVIGGASRDSKLMQYVRKMGQRHSPLRYPNENVQRLFQGYRTRGWGIRGFRDFDPDDADALYRCLTVDGSDFVHDAVCRSEFRHRIASYKGDLQCVTIYDVLRRKINANTTYADAFDEAYDLWQMDPVMPHELVDIVATDALYQILEEDGYMKDSDNYFQLWTQVVKNKVQFFDAWRNIFGSEWDSDKLKKYLAMHWYQDQVSAILSIDEKTSDEQARLFVGKLVRRWYDLDEKRLYVSYLRNKLELAHTIGIIPQEGTDANGKRRSESQASVVDLDC